MNKIKLMLIISMLVVIGGNAHSESFRAFYTNWRIVKNVDEMSDQSNFNMMAFASVEDNKGKFHGMLSIIFLKATNDSLYIQMDNKRFVIVVIRYTLGAGTNKRMDVPLKYFDKERPVLFRIDKTKPFIPNKIVEGPDITVGFTLNEYQVTQLKKGKELRIQIKMNSGEKLLARYKLYGFTKKITMLAENIEDKDQPIVRYWETGRVVPKKK